MIKNPRASVVKAIEEYIKTRLDGKVSAEELQEIVKDIKELKQYEIDQIATAFDDGRVSQKFGNKANGKVYYRLNYHSDSTTNN